MSPKGPKKLLDLRNVGFTHGMLGLGGQREQPYGLRRQIARHRCPGLRVVSAVRNNVDALDVLIVELGPADLAPPARAFGLAERDLACAAARTGPPIDGSVAWGDRLDDGVSELTPSCPTESPNHRPRWPQRWVRDCSKNRSGSHRPRSHRSLRTAALLAVGTSAARRVPDPSVQWSSRTRA